MTAQKDIEATREFDTIRTVEPIVLEQTRSKKRSFDVSKAGYGGSPLAGDELLQQLKKIVEKWYSMKGIKDLCAVLNMALQAMYGMKAKKITVGRMVRLARHGHYVTFEIPKKKKGEFRSIDAPCHSLRNVQRALNLVLQAVYTPHAAATGFVLGKSVVSNAQLHIGQNYVYNIDLKDFFPSITSGRLYNRLLSKPFCLNDKVASLISDLCCYYRCSISDENSVNITEDGLKRVLPQGAPTSPTITNIICERLDFKLTRLAKAYGLKYTRYADDITFSGPNNVFADDGKFCTSLRNIIENEEGFTINTDKTRLCHRGMRQEVTGLTVNSKANVSRKYIKQLRPLIHNWEVKGYNEAQAIFAKHYAATNTRNLASKGEHHIENIISGKLLYLKMVKGEDDATYIKLKKRFDCLMENLAQAPTTKTASENIQPTYTSTSTSLDVRLQRLFESNFDLSVL